MEIDANKFNWSDNEIEKFHEQIEYFKSFRFKTINNENFNDAYRTCYLLLDKIPLAAIKIDVNYILRARLNKANEIFSKEEEISYNKKTEKLGRFNRPYEAMFYGSVPDELSNNHFLLVATMESGKELFEEQNKILKQYFTIGKWYLNTHFEVINLCYDEKLLNSNPKLKISTKRHEAKIFETFPYKSAQFIIEFWKFLSQIAGIKFENDTDHFITTAFLCAITMYRKNIMNLETYGAIFPSTMTENNGLNIVLTPNAVNHFLNLKSVFMVKFARDINNMKKYEIEQCTKEAKVANKIFFFEKMNNY